MSTFLTLVSRIFFFVKAYEELSLSKKLPGTFFELGLYLAVPLFHLPFALRSLSSDWCRTPDTFLPFQIVPLLGIIQQTKGSSW